MATIGVVSVGPDGEEYLPPATVARLPIYLRVLMDATGDRMATISSDHLAIRAGVNAAQVRKDLSFLGTLGTRGVGYDVTYLLGRISRQLGLSEDRPTIIVGAGNLGQALANYRGFPARGFRIVAAFDVDSAKIGGPFGSVSVRGLDELQQVIEEEHVAIAVITTPPQAAQGVADRLVEHGVTSILNFAPVSLQVPSGVNLRQVDLAVELQILSYYRQLASRREPEGLRPEPSEPGAAGS